MIPVLAPVTVSAQPLNLNSFWLAGLQVATDGPNGKVRVIAQVEKIQANVDGSFTRAPMNVKNSRGTVVIADLNASIAVDNAAVTVPSTLGGTVTLSTADIIAALTLRVKDIAEAQKVI